MPVILKSLHSCSDTGFSVWSSQVQLHKKDTF